VQQIPWCWRWHWMVRSSSPAFEIKCLINMHFASLSVLFCHRVCNRVAHGLAAQDCVIAILSCCEIEYLRYLVTSHVTASLSSWNESSFQKKNQKWWDVCKLTLRVCLVQYTTRSVYGWSWVIYGVSGSMHHVIYVWMIMDNIFWSIHIWMIIIKVPLAYLVKGVEVLSQLADPGSILR
jgi:hypothetical protein